MGTSVLDLHAFKGGQFGEDDGQQTGTGEFDEADAGTGREHDFIQFVDDALLRDNADALGIAHEGLLRLFLYLETELGGEAHAAHHAQGVVGEGDVGVEGCGYEAILHVQQAVEAVDEFAEAFRVETDGEGVDGEVATVKVVLQRAVLHDGFARVVTITLATGTNEFQFFTPRL